VNGSAIGHRARPRALVWVAALLAPALGGCTMPAALRPAGPAASAIADNWWLMFWLALAVFIAVVVFLVLALTRQRSDDEQRKRTAYPLLTWAGAIIPGIIVLVTLGHTTYTIAELENLRTEPAVTVNVESHMFWWDVAYPEYGFFTGNEVHVPAGERFAVTLRSMDVIHSFWVPELHGKRDLMPDFTGRIWMQADEPGIYRGQCAEFCGLQHANMHFLIIAHEPDDFEAWLERRQQPAPVPATDRTFLGQQVFLGSECVYCHAVAGTNATGRLGPDLTDIASRRELGAGTLLNTRGNLAAWIIDSQHFKPGNMMPPMPMSGEDLQAMLAYLDTLR
jgi:cytochrome c oxidase subunit 2